MRSVRKSEVCTFIVARFLDELSVRLPALAHGANTPKTGTAKKAYQDDQGTKKRARPRTDEIRLTLNAFTTLFGDNFTSVSIGRGFGTLKGG